MSHREALPVKPTVRHNLQMSREFPQMRLRMPPELRENIEAKSKTNGRSMNAEIVHRLESSFESMPDIGTIISVEEARAIAEKSRSELSNGAISIVAAELSRAIKLGRNSFYFDFKPLVGKREEGIHDEEYYEIIEPALKALRDNGYEVEELDTEFVARM